MTRDARSQSRVSLSDEGSSGQSKGQLTRARLAQRFSLLDKSEQVNIRFTTYSKAHQISHSFIHTFKLTFETSCGHTHSFSCTANLCTHVTLGFNYICVDCNIT